MTETRNKTFGNHRAIWFEVSGNCMTPLIRKGDLVMAVPAINLNIGDIVVISDSDPTVHRVVKVVKGEYALTKGDMSFRVDPPLTKEDLVRKVIAVVKKGNKPVSMEGRLWRIKNYIMARYSLTSFSAWDWLSGYRCLGMICHRFHRPMRRFYISVARVLTRLSIVQRG